MKKVFKTIIKFISFFIIWAVLGGLVPIPEQLSPSIWRFLAELLPLLLMVLITYLYIKFIDKKEYDLKLKDTNFLNYLKAIMIGNIWIFTTIGIAFVLKVLKINGSNNAFLLIWGISLFLNTIMQELLARGYLYQMIKKNHNIIAAIIITTCLFTLMHGGAFEAGILAILNVLSMSLLMTILLEYYNSLWVPIIVHFIWNFIGGLVFGVVSLAEDYPFIYNTVSYGNKIVSGGTFKIEGSIIVTIINIVLLLIYIFLLHNKKKKMLINKEP